MACTSCFAVLSDITESLSHNNDLDDGINNTRLGGIFIYFLYIALMSGLLFLSLWQLSHREIYCVHERLQILSMTWSVLLVSPYEYCIPDTVRHRTVLPWQRYTSISLSPSCSVTRVHVIPQ